jgi:hypothetical protein
MGLRWPGSMKPVYKEGDCMKEPRGVAAVVPRVVSVPPVPITAAPLSISVPVSVPVPVPVPVAVAISAHQMHGFLLHLASPLQGFEPPL